MPSGWGKKSLTIYKTWSDPAGVQTHELPHTKQTLYQLLQKKLAILDHKVTLTKIIIVQHKQVSTF